METRRHTRFYDHRLVRVVQQARDLEVATRAGVPRSTAAGWLKQAPRAVALATDDRAVLDLHRRIAKLERRCHRLQAVLRLFPAPFRVLKPDMSHAGFAGLDQDRLLRAIDRSRGFLGLRRSLALPGLSLSRFHAWARRSEGCRLEDQPSCPVDTPLRHVPSGRLALLAQRMSVVFASTSTW